MLLRSRHALLLALTSAACSSEGTLDQGFDDARIVADFADEVVVPTYGLLATRLDELHAAAEALQADPSEDTLTAARAAWIAARQPWEQSEGFLFGPVDTLGYDPAMDSWPVNRTDLDAVLAAGESFTSEYIGNLQETQKGFHTVEYLTFGVGAAKQASELDARELAYLTAITEELAGVGAGLLESWTDSLAGGAPYRDVVATAGDSDNTAYPSLTAAAQEMLDGMIGICDEVANGKIADPYDAKDPALVESQFAFNSLSDFQNNMRSIENVYTGSVPLAGTSGRGLSAYVASLDADLDARVKAEIAESIDALGAIPPPFRAAILDPEAADSIEAAQAAIRRLHATLLTDVQPLVLR